MTVTKTKFSNSKFYNFVSFPKPEQIMQQSLTFLKLRQALE